ncbi:alpha/beta fold hydrolase [Psychroflexus tropicus]|uniref:alpha/beta fold hydrolase n=1 Tax=Psychroflexus tropicus TaxID=197345 RepID=UPI000381E686|nr:alpha/beta hydrolase [Psychroflexus tropicus]
MTHSTTFSVLFFFLVQLKGFSQQAIQVQQNGEGEPILFLPGFANSSEVWTETLDHLDGTYQTHLIDYAGFNGLPPIDSPWLPRVNQALVDYIQSKDLKQVTLVGHSLGGTLALYLAAELKERVKEIILVDALPYTAKLMFPNQTEFEYDNLFSKSMLEMDDSSFETMATQQVNMMAFNEDKRPQILEWILNTDRKTYVNGYIDYLNFNATTFLEQIDCPVLILGVTSYGEAQAKQTYKDQYQLLKHYDLKMAPTSAHYIMYDQPEWFYTQLNLALND